MTEQEIIESLQGHTIVKVSIVPDSEWPESMYYFILTLDDGRSIQIDGRDYDGMYNGVTITLV